MGVLYEYLIRIITALSVLLNVILGGHSYQSFSARNYAWKKKGSVNFVWLIDACAFFDPDHCKQSYLLFERMSETLESIA